MDIAKRHPESFAWVSCTGVTLPLAEQAPGGDTARRRAAALIFKPV